MEAIKIVSLCIASAVFYGIVHDQFTVRICIEYFTVGHPPVFRTEDPTLLALGWGVIATWWVGLILGVPAAFVSRFGNWPKRTAAQLVRPLGVLLATMACASIIAGCVGWFGAESGRVWLVEPMRSLLPPSKHSAFLADLWAHLAAYAVGIVGGIVVCGHVLLCRYRAPAA